MLRKPDLCKEAKRTAKSVDRKAFTAVLKEAGSHFGEDGEEDLSKPKQTPCRRPTTRSTAKLGSWLEGEQSDGARPRFSELSISQSETSDPGKKRSRDTEGAECASSSDDEPTLAVAETTPYLEKVRAVREAISTDGGSNWRKKVMKEDIGAIQDLINWVNQTGITKYGITVTSEAEVIVYLKECATRKEDPDDDPMSLSVGSSRVPPARRLLLEEVSSECSGSSSSQHSYTERPKELTLHMQNILKRLKEGIILARRSGAGKKFLLSLDTLKVPEATVLQLMREEESPTLRSVISRCDAKTYQMLRMLYNLDPLK